LELRDAATASPHRQAWFENTGSRAFADRGIAGRSHRRDCAVLIDISENHAGTISGFAL
jgi:hypothetical protein